ncbi:aminoglycoside phosphotransferase family protein [Saccharothrix australiensis]|uniref:aminoglycoside phosphotransferase family protein n=1 Tax=Saccharothrix australiensis TaxID=2072 RepID=UPI0014772D7C|nr:aminoglycoside phosphotransferase family protein [Saccharothrix australiensis]
MDGLPDVVDRLTGRWGLRLEGRVLHGNCAVVLPASTAAGERCVLKVSWPDDKTKYEASALAAWGGKGVVLLLDRDDEACALLLERLDEDRSLLDAPVDTAVEVGARLLGELAIPAPDGLPTLADQQRGWREQVVADWARTAAPVPRRVLDAALEASVALSASSASILVDQDLHYANVLAGARESWLVIDPKVVVGDPEFGASPLLWNRFEAIDGPAAFDARLRAVVDHAGLDPDLTRAWTLVRAVDYCVWSAVSGAGPDVEVGRLMCQWLMR